MNVPMTKILMVYTHILYLPHTVVWMHGYPVVIHIS